MRLVAIIECSNVLSIFPTRESRVIRQKGSPRSKFRYGGYPYILCKFECTRDRNNGFGARRSRFHAIPEPSSVELIMDMELSVTRRHRKERCYSCRFLVYEMRSVVCN